MANEDWAKDPNTRPEVLAMLSTSPSAAVRVLVAQNPSAPEMALMHLARDEDDSVRRAVSQRSNVSSDVLRVALLPRELLSQIDAPEPMPEAPAAVGEAAPAAEEATPAQAAPAPSPAYDLPVQAEKKPSWLAWFWRLFGRSA